MPRSTQESTVSRRKKILQLLSDSGEVLVENLSKEFAVSEVTIRNDLDQLEKKNMLIRARGGAIKLETGVGFDQRLADKHKLNYADKARIGKRAALLVNEADTIIIDSGSTTAEMVKNLPDFQDLTVITNALNIANQLMVKPYVNMIIPGGYLRKNMLSLVGPQAEKSLRNFQCRQMLFGRRWSRYKAGHLYSECGRGQVERDHDRGVQRGYIINRLFEIQETQLRFHLPDQPDRQGDHRQQDPGRRQETSPGCRRRSYNSLIHTNNPSFRARLRPLFTFTSLLFCKFFFHSISLKENYLYIFVIVTKRNYMERFRNINKF